MASSPSTVEDDVMRIKRKLDKIMSSADAIDVSKSLDLLNVLRATPIDLSVLKSTGIGVALNSLRKSCNSEELGTLAKSLLKNWKKLVANEQQMVNSPSGNSNDSASKAPDSPASNADSSSRPTHKRRISDSPESNGNHTKSAKIAPSSDSISSAHKPHQRGSNNHLARRISFTQTKDPIRIKCREMLSAALEITEPIENGADLCDVLEIAARCEDVIYAEFTNTDTKYKNRVRSRVINLKDARNPKLRESVRLGIITPDRLASMTADEMASDELKDIRAKFTKESIDDHQMARTQGAKTTLLTCKKCKKNNCSFSEMQTRSADEPMTTFAYCEDCGNRWRFG